MMKYDVTEKNVGCSRMFFLGLDPKLLMLESRLVFLSFFFLHAVIHMMIMIGLLHIDGVVDATGS